jgi:hypothetical protein
MNTRRLYLGALGAALAAGLLSVPTVRAQVAGYIWQVAGVSVTPVRTINVSSGGSFNATTGTLTLSGGGGSAAATYQTLATTAMSGGSATLTLANLPAPTVNYEIANTDALVTMNAGASSGGGGGFGAARVNCSWVTVSGHWQPFNVSAVVTGFFAGQQITATCAVTGGVTPQLVIANSASLPLGTVGGVYLTTPAVIPFP